MSFSAKVLMPAVAILALSGSLPAQEAASQPASKTTTQAAPGSKPWMNKDVRLRLCSPAWRSIGEMAPQEAAKKFPVIVCNPTLEPKLLHQGNPDCKVVKYYLGPYTSKKEMEELKDTGALAKDKDGNVVKARDWENWLVVPDSKAWTDHVAKAAQAAFAQGFDGVFTDSMGTAPIESNYVLTKGLNPSTGQPYDKISWLAAESKMAEAVRKAIPADKLLFMNGLGQGTRYWAEPDAASPRALLKYYDGAMSEQIWRQPSSKLDAWPTVQNWMGEIRMIQDVQKRGLIGMWWTKCWTDKNTSNNEPNADKLVPKWRRFALGSYLLAAGPDSYFNFDTMRNDKPKSNAAEYFVEYDAPLGVATGEMQQVAQSGVYCRAFENGVIVVNPTDKTASGISVPGTEGKSYKSWGENSSVKFPAAVEAHTGLILTVEK